MQAMAELAKATGTNRSKADIRRAYGLADEHVREARGMPPRPVRIPGKAVGQSLALEGTPWLRLAANPFPLTC